MNKHHYYTAEEKQWLVEHIHKCNSYKHLTEMFNEQFGLSVKQHSVSDVCIKQLGIHRGCNTGQIKQGSTLAKTYNIGDEREHSGYIWVKINDVAFKGIIGYDEYSTNWVPKQRYVYEQTHGKIPNGYIVIFLNNNKLDFDIDNLYAVPRNIHQMMCKNQWYTDSREHTLTAIKVCELFYALRDNKQNPV